MICTMKRRLQCIFLRAESLVCQNIQRNVLAALSAFLSLKRRVAKLNGLCVFLTKHKSSSALRRLFSFWHTCLKVSRHRANYVDRIFKASYDQHALSFRQQKQLLGCWKLVASRASKSSLLTILVQNFFKRCLGRRFFRAWQSEMALFVERENRLFKSRACFLAGQQMFRMWAIHVQTRVAKSCQLTKDTIQVAVKQAMRSWAFLVFLIKKMKFFESRRLLNRIKRWQCFVAVRCRFKTQDAFIRMILFKRHALNVCRLVFRLWFERTKINLARSKRQLAAVQHSITRNHKWLQGAFVTWIRVKTTGFGVKRILSERLRKIFFRWHTFVEYRRSKSLLKSKLQHQSSPPSNSR
jgi:hypothetical protein